MKSWITTFLGLMLCFAPLFSQLEIGLGAGYIRSKYARDDRRVKAEPMSGWFVSLPIYAKVSDDLLIGLTSRYVQKDFSDVYFAVSGITAPYKMWRGFKLYYVQFIPEVKYLLHKSFHPGLGIQYGIKLRELQRQAGQDYRQNFGSDAKFRTHDLGISFSLDFRIKRLLINIRHIGGIINMSNPDLTKPEAALHTRSLELSVFYLFYKLKKNQ